MRTKLWTLAKWMAAIGGTALCVHLVLSIGLQEIIRALGNHWLFLLLMTVVYTSYHLLRTCTLRICIPHPTRFGEVFGIRLAGEAVAYIAIGSVLGDTLKVALGRGRIPVVESATGVFAEKLIYHLSGAAFIIGGLLVAVIKFGAGPLLVGSILALSLLFAATVILMSSGAQPLARILRHARVRKPGLRDAALKTEQALFLFCRDHPREFLLAFLLDLLSYFYSIGEVLAILFLLNVHAVFLDLWYYQSVVKFMNTGMMVVPANLGIFEATNVYLARQLAFGAQAGIVTALFIRIRATLWSFIGYIWFLVLLRKSGKHKPSEGTSIAQPGKENGALHI